MCKVGWLSLLPFILGGTFGNGCASGQQATWHPRSRNLASIDISKVQVLGGDESSFNPGVNPTGPAIQDADQYDVVVVGTGLAGLSAGSFLTDSKYKKKVLFLEKEDHIGGLATGGQIGDDHFSRGAAYWTDTYEEEQQILEYIGLGDFKTKYKIPSPIDAYMVRGKFVSGIWFPKSLRDDLPASFTLFKWELEKANNEGFIPNQPFEEFKKMDLDQLDTASWIRSMPEKTRKRGDKRSKAIMAMYDSQLASGRMTASDPMIDVVELMDLYCRSALGTNSDKVSAMAFANFYISEIVTRYTSPVGTSQATLNMQKLLTARGALATIKTSTPVVRISNKPDHVEVRYVENGQLHAVNSQYVVFSAQLNQAPKLIDGFTEQSPEQARLMSEIGYAHYSVHEVQVAGHPYRGAYDTWSHATDYTENDPTDMVLGRWVALKGYKPKPAATDSTDIFTIYHPLPQSALGSYSKEEAAQIALVGTDRMLDLFQPLFDSSFTDGANWKDRGILKIVTNMWPYSVHIASKGYYTDKVKVMRKPFGRIVFAHNNLGTPAFEEALFRGHCGADNVLSRMIPDFQKEPWSNCPIE